MRHTQGSKSRSSASSRSGSRGPQGFSSMSPSERRRSASEGDRHVRWGYQDDDNNRQSWSSSDNEDYDNYNDVEDESYERGGYGRSGGRGSLGRGYSLSEERDADQGYDYNDYSDDEVGYNQGRRSGSGQRGFAAMDPEERREIARMGGRASHGGGRSDRRHSNRSSRY